jgi:Xaa-Pro aminopeptidase/Xaa-Pro dipeptidase
MSGPNGARAYGAYARSTDRVLAEGDLALVHCNSYADGFWTDITRTYSAGGAPREADAALFDAVREARAAALAAIRPGARARDVDRAAREALTAHGLGDLFKHPTGHAVGFTAIDHDAPPRLHPRSPDVLEEGMVFNVEPAVYREGHGGIRYCDMVAVTATGANLLTPFQPDVNGRG